MDIIITESPRDAYQSIQKFIPTQNKVDYINTLINVGFDIIDVGSLVSPKAIPQVADTAEVLRKLDLTDTETEIMVLVANKKGIEFAKNLEVINWISYPFSVSPTFLSRNINATIKQGLEFTEYALDICNKYQKKLKVYLTMAFGNPYNDKYNPEIVFESVTKLHSLGIRFITLSDITGVATPELITQIFSKIISGFPDVEFGLHLHTSTLTYYDKLHAAYSSGCRSFDSVINGLGGCPMTGYEMVSNLNTLNLIDFFSEKHIETRINRTILNEAVKKNQELFF